MTNNETNSENPWIIMKHMKTHWKNNEKSLNTSKTYEKHMKKNEATMNINEK
jgi:hypothetical protein